MKLDALKSSIEAEARVFAESIAKLSIIAFTQELSKTVIFATAPVSEPVPLKRKRGRPALPKGDCKAAGCEKKVLAKGLCSTHYQKARAKIRAKAAESNGEVAAATA